MVPLSLANAATDIEVTVDQVVSIFENSSMEIKYSSIVDIHDGRGYTAGKAGFTSATGDLLEVAERYSKSGHDNFNSLLPLLRERADRTSGDLSGLESLPEIWKMSCRDESFLRVQDELVEDWYKRPAREAMIDFGIKTKLGYLIFYDTIIQHGDGEDPDSFWGIIKLMRSTPSEEKLFLDQFLKARLKVLKNPADPETRDAWRESVDRVHALQKLVKESRWNLERPFTLKVWDETFEFKKQ